MDGRSVGWWILGGLVVGVVSSYAAEWLWYRGRCRCRNHQFGSLRDPRSIRVAPSVLHEWQYTEGYDEADLAEDPDLAEFVKALEVAQATSKPVRFTPGAVCYALQKDTGAIDNLRDIVESKLYSEMSSDIEKRPFHRRVLRSLDRLEQQLIALRSQTSAKPIAGLPPRGFGADLSPADPDEPEVKPIPPKIQAAIDEHILDEETRQQVRESISLDDEEYSYKGGVLRVGDDDRHYGTPSWYYRGQHLSFACGRFSLRYEGTVRRGYKREFATVREWKQHVDEEIARRQER